MYNDKNRKRATISILSVVEEEEALIGSDEASIEPFVFGFRKAR